MDINQLFTEDGMRDFTNEQRDLHMQDASQYAQIGDVVRRRVQNTPIEGDRWTWWATKRRAWKVSRQVKTMEKGAKLSATGAEGLYTVFKYEVLELPERREAAEERRQERREVRKGRRGGGSIGARAAKSLDKSTAHFNGLTSINGVPDPRQPNFLDAEPSYYPMAAGAEGQPTGVADFFRGKQAGR
jgi:hypothetical protein